MRLYLSLGGPQRKEWEHPLLWSKQADQGSLAEKVTCDLNGDQDVSGVQNRTVWTGSVARAKPYRARNGR